MRRLSAYKLTPGAIVLLVIFIASAVLAFVASSPANMVAFVIAVIVASVPVVGRVSAGRGTLVKNLPERQEEFPAARRRGEGERVDPSAESDAWARERRRYRERG
jgi:hypothetical protein